MRAVNHHGRLTLVGDGDPHGTHGLDVQRASGGAIPADPAAAFAQWDDVRALDPSAGSWDVEIDRARLRSPSPAPLQIFGIGLNYADHGAEAGMALPEVPLIFTKLQTAIAGPYDAIELDGTTVDWEVEVVVVIGRAARHVAAADAWDHVAGITAGQDLSDRDVQMRPASQPQFGLGKSLKGFAPLGPVLVTPDELADPDDIGLACRLNGEEVQRSRTSKLIFGVGRLIAYLSEITELRPGDVLFTGTPSGIGMTRTPPRYLAPGDELSSEVEGVGTMRHTFTAAARAARAPAA